MLLYRGKFALWREKYGYFSALGQRHLGPVSDRVVRSREVLPQEGYARWLREMGPAGSRCALGATTSDEHVASDKWGH